MEETRPTLLQRTVFVDSGAGIGLANYPRRLGAAHCSGGELVIFADPRDAYHAVHSCSVPGNVRWATPEEIEPHVSPQSEMPELETYLAGEVTSLETCLREYGKNVTLFEERLERVKARAKKDDQGLTELEDYLAGEVMRLDWAIGTARQKLALFERRLSAAQRLRELS